MPVPPRIAAAVDVLDVRPGDSVLEVGGGNGVSARLICARIGHGQLVALDRSAVASQRNSARNADHVAAGRLIVRTGALADFDGHDRAFQRVLALNVNAFWTGPADAELAALHQLMQLDGVLVLAWGAEGPQREARIVDAATAGLGRHAFGDIEPIRDPRLVGVTARAR